MILFNSIGLSLLPPVLIYMRRLYSERIGAGVEPGLPPVTQRQVEEPWPLSYLLVPVCCSAFNTTGGRSVLSDFSLAGLGDFYSSPRCLTWEKVGIIKMMKRKRTA